MCQKTCQNLCKQNGRDVGQVCVLLAMKMAKKEALAQTPTNAVPTLQASTTNATDVFVPKMKSSII